MHLLEGPHAYNGSAVPETADTVLRRWIKAMEGKMGLRICKPGEVNLMRTLEACIRLGQPLLVEEMGPTLEPQLLPLLEGTVTSLGHRRYCTS